MQKPYNKPPLTIEAQVNQLAQRGLEISKPSEAADYLSRVNYYRLSGYCIPFEVTRHSFRPGTQFSSIVMLCEFDGALRDLIQEALTWLEIGLKSHVAYYVAHQMGPFGHLNLKNFISEPAHTEWRKAIHSEIERSKETFVEHFRATYSEYPDLPIWAEVEVQSFGSFSRMFKNLTKSHQTKLANPFGIKGLVFESWLHSLSYVRNLCAHNARLWNRELAIKPRIPRNHQEWLNATHLQHRVAVILKIVRHFFKTPLFKTLNSSPWEDKMKAILATRKIGDVDIWLGMGLS